MGLSGTATAACSSRAAGWLMASSFLVIDVELFVFGEDLVGRSRRSRSSTCRSRWSFAAHRGEMFTRVARSVSRSEETARDINQRRDLCFPIRMGKLLQRYAVTRSV